jgi:hypothetical protein
MLLLTIGKSESWFRVVHVTRQGTQILGCSSYEPESRKYESPEANNLLVFGFCRYEIVATRSIPVILLSDIFVFGGGNCARTRRRPAFEAVSRKAGRPCAKTVPESIVLQSLGLTLSESQIPQIIENTGKPK